MAQGAFKTGWWHYCWDYNLGNAKHVSGDGRDYCMVRLNEVIGGKVVWFDPSNPATWLRAFDSLSAGVIDYLSLMRGQFGYAWPAVETGDVTEFCHRLHQRGYYTDDEHHYTANVLGCYHQLDLVLPQDTPVADVAHGAIEQAATELDVTGGPGQDIPPGNAA